MQCIFLPGYEFVFHACRFALAEKVSYLFYKDTIAVCYFVICSEQLGICFSEGEKFIH